MRIQKRKTMLIAGGALVAAVGIAHAAAIGTWQNIIDRYLLGNQPGNSANIPAGIAFGVTDFTTFETELSNFVGFTCTAANGCYTRYDRNGNQTTYPTGGDNAAQRHKLVAMVGGFLQANPTAAPIVIDCVTNDKTNLDAAIPTAAAKGAKLFNLSFTIPVADQGTINTYLSTHTLLPVVPDGYLSSAKRVGVGMTQDNGSGADMKYNPGDVGLVVSFGHNVVFPWGTEDSPELAASTVAGVLGAQSGTLLTSAQLAARPSSEFIAISGSATLGVWNP
jgi:hypothetical protein